MADSDPKPAGTQGKDTTSGEPVLVSPVSGPGFSPDVAEPGELPDNVEPTVDVVAMVSRDANGDPMQTVNYQVLVHPDAPDDVKAAHFNLAGKAAGARYADAVDTDVPANGAPRANKVQGVAR